MAIFYKFFLVVLVIFFFAFAIEAQATCTRYAEAGSGFSICMPDNWTKADDPGETLKKFFAPPSKGGRTNLNFQLVVNGSPLADYVTAMDEYSRGHVSQIGADSVALISRTDFITDSKEKGVRLVYQMSAKGKNIRSLQFCFTIPSSRKVILTFTAIDVNNEGNDKLFDGITATFKTEK